MIWNLLFLVALVLWFVASQRAMEHARRAGYWRGLLDATVAKELEERHAWSEGDDFAVQIHAQQAAIFNVPQPDEWPPWDGVDRIGPRVRPELARTYQPLDPRPWWRKWRRWR
jgi:hypothetical protein